VAGNDANFALKALLLLAVKSVENRDLTLEQKSRLLRIQAVAQVPIEDNTGGKTPDELTYRKIRQARKQKRAEERLKWTSERGKREEENWAETLASSFFLGDDFEDCQTPAACETTMEDEPADVGPQFRSFSS